MGKDWNLMRFEMMERTNDLILTMSRMLTALKDDPGRWIAQLFENRTLLIASDTGKWWEGVVGTMQKITDRADSAIEASQYVFSELMAVQNSMPEVIRKNIPEEIWNSLAAAEGYIAFTILPAIAALKRNLEIVDNMMSSLSARGSDLAEKLANPGDLLLGVDELPEYVKKYQEGLIDDVTSREFGFWTDKERSEIQSELDDFDRIDRLIKAPTPEPELYTLEIKKGQTFRGITAEPHETWFPGGLNDSR
ncbi:MAG: hypothetical protein L0922_00200 [Candidatus Mariimomonas ferrooxydans]